MKKIISQNLLITIGSKFFGFISFIYIAKVLTESDYGVFVYISMLLSLLPLLQLGSMHGTMILLPKYINDSKKDEKNLFLYYSIVSHLIQGVACVVLIFFDIEISTTTVFIIMFTFFLSLYTANAIMLLLAQHEFEKANLIKFIDQVLKPISVLFFFYYFNNIDSIFYGQFLITIATLLLSIYFVKLNLNIKNLNIEKFKINIQNIYKIGFFIYLTWGIDIIFRTADKWFISQFYSLEELATYGFTSSLAMNVWLLAMSFFAPYAQVLYTFVAKGQYQDVKNTVESTNKKLYILLLIVSAVAIIAYPFVLELIIKRYFNTEFLFFVLVVSAIFLSINNMYIYYMISNNFHFVLLKYQVFVLLLNLLLNGFFAFYHLDILYFSYSTIISLSIYFILVRRYFYLDIKRKLETFNA
jgi:O-antigen/teichoic acid export membrane protein